MYIFLISCIFILLFLFTLVIVLCLLHGMHQSSQDFFENRFSTLTIYPSTIPSTQGFLNACHVEKNRVVSKTTFRLVKKWHQKHSMWNIFIFCPHQQKDFLYSYLPESDLFDSDFFFQFVFTYIRGGLFAPSSFQHVPVDMIGEHPQHNIVFFRCRGQSLFAIYAVPFHSFFLFCLHKIHRLKTFNMDVLNEWWKEWKVGKTLDVIEIEPDARIQEKQDDNVMTTATLPLFKSPSVSSSETESRLPKILALTFHTRRVEKQLYSLYTDLVNKNPSFRVYFFDDHHCVQFLQRYFPSIVLESFSMLKPGAFRADLFRYCFLYVYGGFYIDVNKQLLRPLDDCIPTDTDMVLIRDINQNDIFQAFLGCRPHSLFMKKCIDTCVNIIQQRDKTDDSLSITGPKMMGRVFQTHYGLSLASFKDGHHRVGDETILIWSHRPGIVSRQDTGEHMITTQPYRNRHQQWKKLYHQERYDVMWRLNNIYSLSYGVVLDLTHVSKEQTHVLCSQWIQETTLTIYIMSPFTLSFSHGRCETTDSLQHVMSSHRYDFVFLIRGDMCIPQFQCHIQWCPATVDLILPYSLYDEPDVDKISCVGFSTKKQVPEHTTRFRLQPMYVVSSSIPKIV